MRHWRWLLCLFPRLVMCGGGGGVHWAGCVAAYRSVSTEGYLAPSPLARFLTGLDMDMGWISTLLCLDMHVHILQTRHNFSRITFIDYRSLAFFSCISIYPTSTHFIFQTLVIGTATSIGAIGSA